MGEKERQQRRNDLLRNCFKYGQKVNIMHYSLANTDIHEDYKWFIFRTLRRQGFNVLTEAEFLFNKGRADLVDLDNQIIWEVAHSESNESIESKKEKYPDCFEIKIIRTDKPFNERDVL
jgi:hypothetical protein